MAELFVLKHHSELRNIKFFFFFNNKINYKCVTCIKIKNYKTYSGTFSSVLRGFQLIGQGWPLTLTLGVANL